MTKRGSRSQSEVRRELEALLAGSYEDASLRERLEELARELAFAGLTFVWAPALYRRHPVFFRPFIWSHFSEVAFLKPWKWRPVEWKGEVAERLEPWLAELDQRGETDLFRRLYRWKLARLHYKKRVAQWRADLLERVGRAGGRQQRQLEFEKLSLGLELDEETATKLYRQAPQESSAFILRHLSRRYNWKLQERRELWSELAQAARERGDDDLFFSLYRRQVPLDRWQQDALAVAERETEPDKLVQELRRRHPEGFHLDLGPGYLALVERRGPAVFPYLVPELSRLGRGWFKRSFERLLKLAEERGWWDFWGGLVRVAAGHKEYDAIVARAIAQGHKERLLLLTGVSREWNLGGLSLGLFHYLEDATAVALYRRYPELLRGPFKAQIQLGPAREYPRLLELALSSQDEVLTDFLASRLVNRVGVWDKPLLALAEKLARVYQPLLENPPEFARRAAAVLGQVPPYTVYNYHALVRNNRLARLLYEQSASYYLADATAFQDLLESPEIHAQKTAYRALATGGQPAEQLGRANLELLLGTLLRPLHRKTRLAAFLALEAIAGEVEVAARILARARQTLDLPARGYPKEELVGLIGRLLHRHPSLRTPAEQPVVYR